MLAGDALFSFFADNTGSQQCSRMGCKSWRPSSVSSVCPMMAFFFYTIGIRKRFPPIPLIVYICCFHVLAIFSSLLFAPFSQTPWNSHVWKAFGNTMHEWVSSSTLLNSIVHYAALIPHRAITWCMTCRIRRFHLINCQLYISSGSASFCSGILQRLSVYMGRNPQRRLETMWNSTQRVTWAQEQSGDPGAVHTSCCPCKIISQKILVTRTEVFIVAGYRMCQGSKHFQVWKFFFCFFFISKLGGANNIF